MRPAPARRFRYTPGNHDTAAPHSQEVGLCDDLAAAGYVAAAPDTFGGAVTTWIPRALAVAYPRALKPGAGWGVAEVADAVEWCARGPARGQGGGTTCFGIACSPVARAGAATPRAATLAAAWCPEEGRALRRRPPGSITSALLPSHTHPLTPVSPPQPPPKGSSASPPCLSHTAL